MGPWEQIQASPSTSAASGSLSEWSIAEASPEESAVSSSSSKEEKSPNEAKADRPNPFSVLASTFNALAPVYHTDSREEARKVIPLLCTHVANAALAAPDEESLDIAHFLTIISKHLDDIYQLACDPDVLAEVKDCLAQFVEYCSLGPESGDPLSHLLHDLITLAVRELPEASARTFATLLGEELPPSVPEQPQQTENGRAVEAPVTPVNIQDVNVHALGFKHPVEEPEWVPRQEQASASSSTFTPDTLPARPPGHNDTQKCGWTFSNSSSPGLSAGLPSLIVEGDAKVVTGPSRGVMVMWTVRNPSICSCRSVSLRPVEGNIFQIETSGGSCLVYDAPIPGGQSAVLSLEFVVPAHLASGSHTQMYQPFETGTDQLLGEPLSVTLEVPPSHRASNSAPALGGAESYELVNDVDLDDSRAAPTAQGVMSSLTVGESSRLCQLADLGFTDTARNRQLLRDNDNDLNRVALILMQDSSLH